MKRFYLLIFLLLFFVFDNGQMFVKKFYLSDLDFQYSVATYSEIPNINFVSVGDLKIYKFDSCYEGIGEYSFDAVSEMVEISLSDFLNNKYFKELEMVKYERVEDIEFIYLYDSSLSKILNLGSSVFNLQVAIKNDVVKVGYPCIVDSV